MSSEGSEAPVPPDAPSAPGKTDATVEQYPVNRAVFLEKEDTYGEGGYMWTEENNTFWVNP